MGRRLDRVRFFRLFCSLYLMKTRNRVRARSATSGCCTRTGPGFSTLICRGGRRSRTSGRFRHRRTTRSIRGRYGAWWRAGITRRCWRRRSLTRARRGMGRATRSNPEGSALNPIRFSGMRAMLLVLIGRSLRRMVQLVTSTVLPHKQQMIQVS